MSIESRELTIEAVVSEETCTATTGGDEIYRTQYGNNNADAEPPGTGKTLSASLLSHYGADEDMKGLSLMTDGTQPSEGSATEGAVGAGERVAVGLRRGPRP
jgi:hypothetical protein